ncbi:MAG: carbohydrate porin [Acetobacteraceae bacterium]|nr:carbohydrate porin [Acetobacteraceae bacterium]
MPAASRATCSAPLLAALLAAAPALAQPAPAPGEETPPAAPETRQATPGGEQAATESPKLGLWERANLFGDPGGVRTALANLGVTFGLNEQAEALGNPTGGVRQGAIYEGLLTMSVGVDTQKAFGLPGGIFNASAYQIQGRGLSRNDLDSNLSTISSIEALRGTLLFELWYQQSLLGDRLSIRVGQLAADQEFMISQYGGLFLNETFGWSAFPSSNLPSGGPAYPLATPGARVRFLPRDDLAVLLAVFNGDPTGPGTGFPQARDASGTDFRTSDGALVIGEVQYAINGGDNAHGLPGTYKLGAWYNTDNFVDQRRDASGRSLANPTGLTAVIGASRRGDWSFYGVADQLVWREPGTKDQGIGVFARAMGGPGDRNLVNFYLDTGATWKGAIPGRDADTVGLGFALARISDTAAKLDSDIVFYTGQPYPIRRFEAALELTYQAQIAPWWQVQPDAQYIFNPNGGVPDPLNPRKRVGDAAVFGVRTNITF